MRECGMSHRNCASNNLHELISPREDLTCIQGVIPNDELFSNSALPHLEMAWREISRKLSFALNGKKMNNF
jgi:hypothetical protein